MLLLIRVYKFSFQWKKKKSKTFSKQSTKIIKQSIFSSFLMKKQKRKKMIKRYKMAEMRKYIKRWNCCQLNTLTGRIHLNNNESKAFKSFVFAVLSFLAFLPFTPNKSLCYSLPFSVPCYCLFGILYCLRHFLRANILPTQFVTPFK